MAQGLALALHEMATNAAKHGALSSMAGKVSVAWQVQPDDLILQWVETGGPRIAPPPARSFGLNVIRASIEKSARRQDNVRLESGGYEVHFIDPAARHWNFRRVEEDKRRG